MTAEAVRHAGRPNQVGNLGQPVRVQFSDEALIIAAPGHPASISRTWGRRAQLIEVRFLPDPITSNSHLWFFYELHVRHTVDRDSRLNRVEVLDGDTGRRLLFYDGPDLLRHSLERTHQGYADVAERGETNPSVCLPAAVLVALAAEPGSVPRNLVHRVTFVSAEGRQTVEDGAQVPVPTGCPAVVGPPVRGRNWIAINTPHKVKGHRKTLLEVDGRDVVAQRFAIDFARLGWNRKTWRGDRFDNFSYYAYGADILAVSGGIVSSTRDGIPDNVPGDDSRAVDITLDTVAGNYVIVDSGEGKYFFYGHLQPGSLRVEPGAEVRRGDVLGLLGNSGNSTEPHLHFHIGDADSPLGAEGLPYVFDSFFKAWGLRRRRLELPLERSVVAFR